MDDQNRIDPKLVLESLPEPRLRPFRFAAEDDSAKTLQLYNWNAQMAGAALEQLSYLEVLLRHAIDRRLAKTVAEEFNGIPWFLLPPFYDAQKDTLEKVRRQLRPIGKETRDQIIAGLPLGFWTGWFGSKYEQLWRDSLYEAFPNGTKRRKEITALTEQIRKFRNRVAHHDSLLNVDIQFEMDAVFKLAEIIDTNFATWMKSVDRTVQVSKNRPITPLDTVVVPTTKAWDFYQNSRAYICQAGRYFQKTKHIAFYANREIQQEIPAIKRRYDNVVWNHTEANRLMDSPSRDDRKLGKIMQNGLDCDWTHGKYQVFILSQPSDPSHVRLPAPLKNDRDGRSSAFVRRQRYTSIHKLRHADDVWDLA